MIEEMLQFSWNEFEFYAVKTRFDLFESKQFSDVTLVTDDQTQFEAHRIILAGASNIFNKLLSSVSGDRSSLIFLNGVKSIELKDILQYIYLGNVPVEEKRVREFLRVANDLQIPSIEGNFDKVLPLKEKEFSRTKLDFLPKIPQTETLIESTKSSCKTEQKGLTFLQKSQTKLERIEQRNLRNDFNPRTVNTDSLLQLNTNDEPTESIDSEIQTSGRKDNVVASNISKEKDILVQNHKTFKLKKEEKPANVVKRPCDEPAECEVCAKKFTTLRSMQRHHKVVHELIRYDCPQCGVSCPGRDGVRSHIITKHENQKRVYCKKCDASFKFHNKKALRVHMEREHPLPACDFHNLTFQTIQEFDVHIQVEHINKNWD